MTRERRNNHRLTQSSELHPFYVPMLSTLCQEPVGDHMCDARFAGCGIEVERGQRVLGRWVTSH